jgi:SAM-dependent methyltransferase
VTDTGRAATSDPEDYYQAFSYEVGIRDWLLPNQRHEQLKLLAGDVLRGRRGLRILDIGCGAGVMTDFLTRYGTVTGVDFSRPAIRLAEALSSASGFRAGRLEDVGADARFDLITLFDVLEHIPLDEREGFLAAVRSRLAPGGSILASTPHPTNNRWLAANRPELLQVVDEAVQLADVIAASSALGLELVYYRTYDIDWRRHYQVFALEEVADAEDTPGRDPRLGKRLVAVRSSPALLLRRLRLAGRALRSGRPSLARWLLLRRGYPPPDG